MKRFTWPVLLATLCLFVAACGGSSSKTTTTAQQSTGKIGGKLVIDNVSGSTWTCQFNPFNASLLGPGITFALI